MNWFSKKPVVEFACHVDGLEKIMPIIPAKKYRHPWLLRAFKEFSQLKKQPEYGMSTSAHVAQCPGILAIMHQGWILQAWQDILIDTAEDGLSYKWSTPFDEKEIHAMPAVTLHSPKELVDFFEHWDSPTKFIFKLNVPWECKVPKGYAMLTLPVAYADENRFETVPGLVTHDYGWMALNPQIKWKASAGKTLIKAGTPLAQFILIKMEDVQIRVCYRPELVKNVKLRSMFIRSRFATTAKSVKDFLGKHNHD